ncbi:MULTISPECIES: DUF4349 domain-containing protein [unclassified Streptomyces]|uniref:DUF4349 domain-containing protein n=1 Tax=unclassified Streptomyces TaxID=2593676 RepID=UPI0033B0B8FF
MQTRRSVRPVQALAGVLLAAALALTGCGGADSADGGSDAGGKAFDSGAREQDAKAADGGGSGRGSAGAQSRPTAAPKAAASHIIRTASLTVQVKDVPDALADARTTAEDAGGFVGSETTRRDERGHERTRVVLRVPVERYEEVLDDLEGSGKLLARTGKAQDVTEQVVDVESRVKSQRASVARIRELMDKATKLADVVTLEGELSSRQADLESLLAQQASLKDRTSLATITLSLTQTPVKKAGTEDEDPGFLDALAGGWHAFVTTLRWIAVAFGAVLPFLAGAALLVLLWARLVRPRLSRRTAPAPSGGALPVAPPVRPQAGGRAEARGEGAREQD